MVATWKKDYVKGLAQKMSKSKVVGLVRISGIPSRQFQLMRKNLSGKIGLEITRNSLIKLALKKAKIEGLDNYVDGPTGVILTDLDPFELERLLSKNRTKSPAKVGSIAPSDIMIPRGNTPFAPGPIIGELQEAGMKAKIEGGKIVIKEDSLLVSAGQPIPEKIVKILGRFGIEPIEIGLDLNAAYEEGTIYTSDVLHIDETTTINRLQQAHLNSLNLALNSGMYNNATIPLLVRKAHAEAKNLAFNAEILTRETVEFLISKAGRQAEALSSLVPEEEELGKEEVKEEKALTEEPGKEDKAETEEEREDAPKGSGGIGKKESTPKKEEETTPEKTSGD